MATPKEIQQQLASRQPTVTPVGDVPAATARAATTGAAAPVQSSAAQLTALPAPKPAPISVGVDGVAMTPAQASSRAALGATPDVVRAQRAHPGFTDPAAPPPAAAPAPAAPAGQDITADFNRRAAAARAGVDAGGAPRVRPLSQVELGAANENLRAATGAAAPAAEVAPAASRAERVGGAVGRAARGASNVVGSAARLGAAPVETTARRTFVGRAADKIGVPGRAAPGQKAGAGGMLATVGALSALESLNRPTEDYRKRLGMDAEGGAVGDVVARTAGVLSDFGAAIPDSIIGLTNGMGLTDMRPFASKFADRAGDFKPHYATDNGFFASPLPSGETGEQQQENAQWRARTLQEQADAARASAGGGQNQPSSADKMTTAQPATAGNNQPATAAQSQAAAPAPGAPAATLTPEQAMQSNAKGTAVINGRVVSPEEIAQLANRNVVSSEAFTNPSVGDLYGQTHGGATPTTDQAIDFRQKLGESASAQRLFGTDESGNPVGVSGGIGAPQDQRQKTVSSLMGQITNALSSGRRRTAKILVDQLAAFDRASQGDMDNSLRRDALNKPPKATPQTPAEEALALARAGEAQTQQQVAQMSLAQAAQAQKIQQKLLVETDPGKRATLQQNLEAITGKGGSGNQLKMADFTVGDGLNSTKIPVPVDMRTGAPVISPEYVALIEKLRGLSGGQPQAQ